jgi:hypothetical protein
VQELPVEPLPEASDVSSEWEDSLSIEQAAPVHEPQAAPVHEEPAVETPATLSRELASDNPEVVETVEEARFYLEHFMPDQARAALEKLESLTRDPSILAPLRAQIEAASQAQAEPEAEITEISVEETSEAETPEFELHTEAHSEAEIAASPDLMAGYHEETRPEVPQEAEPAEIEPVQAEGGDLAAFVADLESSLGDSFPAAEPPAREPLRVWPAMPAPKPEATPEPAVRQPAPVAPGAEPMVARADTLPAAPKAPAAAAVPVGGAAAAAVAPAMSYSPTPARPLGAGAQAMHPSDSIDLSEMFGELKHELEEDVASADEDPETHYNLGVAFREMGLLDEAIAELQKVCTAIDRGHTFTQTVQTYTWLAQCFLDKGVPQAAIRWYEKALAIPGLDQESRVAINYELGSACETAQDRVGALRHFTDVYGANIDYRDVAERIQALKS